MKKSVSKIFALVLVLAMCISALGCAPFRAGEYEPTLPDSNAHTKLYGLNVNTSEGRVYDRVQAVKKVERSVVGIKMEYKNSSGGDSSSSGSGVIVDNLDPNDNVFYVLTCHHVIDSKGDITVYVPDMNSRNFTDDDYDEDFAFKGVIDNTIRTGAITLVGGDRLGDIAVLKLDVTGTGVTKNQIVSAVLPTADYEMLRGESVFAVGNPSGELPMTVSDGIISYLDRKIELSDVGEMVLTQIDVQINHGSSGGGLFNYYGELIGITNAGSELYDGTNYAIPYKHTYLTDGGFVDIAEQLIATYNQTFGGKNYGYVSGRWEIGVTVKAYSQNIQNPVVIAVSENSNAEGVIKVNDIIKSISCSSLSYQKDVNSMDAFASAVSYLRTYLSLGDSFTIEVQRGNAVMPLVINLTEQLIFCDTGYRN